MVGLGFTREEVRDSLTSQKYNEVTATYLLLGRKNEVRVSALFLLINVFIVIFFGSSLRYFRLRH